jgi:hypothetical protein
VQRFFNTFFAPNRNYSTGTCAPVQMIKKQERRNVFNTFFAPNRILSTGTYAPVRMIKKQEMVQRFFFTLLKLQTGFLAPVPMRQLE